MEYRHELKFLVSALEIEKLRSRLDAIMVRDRHQVGEAYTIRSLYFDDIYDSCLQEVLDGVDNRKKYRLRLYNGSADVIHLEKKSKLRGMTHKVSETVPEAVCARYMAGDLSFCAGALSTELMTAGLCRGMSPRCIVEYERCAFVEEVGNVRITFDTDIRGTGAIHQFLDPKLSDVSYVLPKGLHILEVKFDEFLPEYILQTIDLNSLRRTSFSKYTYVRNCTDCCVTNITDSKEISFDGISGCY